MADPSPQLASALASAGLSWTLLLRSTEQIVLFGSRAADLSHPASDWDLLCVGEQRSIKAGPLDMVWVAPRALGRGEWLTGELAGHVARYGRWLHGPADWAAEVACGPEAAERKARRLAGHLAAMERAWDLLSPPYQQKHLDLLRRDLQRYACLRRGEAVPPGPTLDQAWYASSDLRERLRALALEAGMCSAFLETRLTAEASSPPCEYDPG